MPNTDTMKGQWQQLKGRVKQQWGDLTDDDLTEIAGNRDTLLGKLRERYGLAKEKAIEQLEHFERVVAPAREPHH